MKNLFIVLFVFCYCSTISFAKSYVLQSPDGKLVVTIKNEDLLTLSVSYKQMQVLSDSPISMKIGNGVELGVKAKVKKAKENEYNKQLIAVVSHKDKTIEDHYKELILRFKGDYQLAVRAYNDGFAYRFITRFDGSIEVLEEQLALAFSKPDFAYFPEEESLQSHYERDYLRKKLEDITADNFCSLPAMVQLQNGVKILVSESDLFDYPNLFLKGSKGNHLSAKFPHYPLTIEAAKTGPDRNETIVKEANYIAKTKGSRSFPWRAFIVSDDDKTFVESNLMLQLARPLAIEKTDWIKPGRVAWDWYNANNIFGVDFEAGINNETYKYYIDFAAKYGLEYIILDEGWSKSTTNIMENAKDIDVEELVEYGNSKGVGIILWMLWKPLDENLNEILNLYQKWDVKGIKVDFMQRADQAMVNFYEKVAKACAERQLLVDFHGAYKPAGLRAAYPNVINYEGLRGNENNKWSADITPEHNTTLPFIRMAAGPIDFTPGAMRNAQKENYAISFMRPMSLGTRAHQVAMYVVYESPLQMLCDTPSSYLKDEHTVAFIAQIPSTWEETVVLEGQVGDYIAVARKKDDVWYIGAMTDWDTRTLELELSFLETGNYEVQIMQDGPNANKHAEDYQVVRTTVKSGDKLKATMAKGGGWTAILKKK